MSEEGDSIEGQRDGFQQEPVHTPPLTRPGNDTRGRAHLVQGHRIYNWIRYNDNRIVVSEPNQTLFPPGAARPSWVSLAERGELRNSSRVDCELRLSHFYSHTSADGVEERLRSITFLQNEHLNGEFTTGDGRDNRRAGGWRRSKGAGRRPRRQRLLLYLPKLINGTLFLH
ncbi:hypothetical protein EVAR_23849_1 [Eumeta japonica]|uniref:Uncharacterized protein n=1 Tax=Eumeta variegata TaxID=151549 RepID=A0A4C1V5A8_EUMVA|nr:hypothetical protein EVAR_23849_1 [Eumeta japonica]